MRTFVALLFAAIASSAFAGQKTYLKCSPTKLAPGDVLTLEYKMHATPEIVVTNPLGQQSFIAHHIGLKKSSGSVKIKIGESISLSDSPLHPPTNGKKNVFDRPGKYKIEAGDISVGDSPDYGDCAVEVIARKASEQKTTNNTDTQPSESADQRHDVRGEVTINLGKAISDGLKGLFSGTTDTDLPNNSERQSSPSPEVRSGKAQKAGESSFPKSLIGIFRKSPAHEGGRVGWPRIAVTILDDGSTGCTGMRAKVWHTASRSEVKSFHVCEGDVSRLAEIGGVKGAGTSQQMKDLLLAMPSRSNQYMAGVDRVIDAPSECFASEEDLRRLKRKRPAVCDDLKKSVNYKARTEGPTPAPEPLPDEARSMFNRVNDRFSDIALITQYDPSIDDRRLWLVRYDLQH